MSFVATDPTLTSHEESYFIMMAHSDFSQISATISQVGYYGWRQVVAMYVDGEHGKNGVSIWEDVLRNMGAKITHKEMLLPHIIQSNMGNMLETLGLVEA